MKKYLLTAMCMVLSLCGYAQSNACYFNLAEKGAQNPMLSIAFENAPVVTYDYEEATGVSYIVVSTNGEKLAAFALDKQYEITYTDQYVPVGVKEIVAASKMNLRGGVAVLSGLKANEAVNVYTANGAQVANAVADANGVAQINLSAMPKGVVIVKAGKSSFKINK